MLHTRHATCPPAHAGLTRSTTMVQLLMSPQARLDGKCVLRALAARVSRPSPRPRAVAKAIYAPPENPNLDHQFAPRRADERGGVLIAQCPHRNPR